MYILSLGFPASNLNGSNEKKINEGANEALIKVESGLIKSGRSSEA
jgi:hypothetical protein